MLEMVINETDHVPKEDVELRQFRTIVTSHEQNLNRWIDVFNKFDKNGDGKISFKELKAGLREYHDDIPSSTVRTILRKADADENGVVDLNEFLQIVKANNEIRGLFSKSVDRWVQTVCVIPRRRRLAGGDELDTDIIYEEYYSLCPPPLFMIGITIVEIIAYIYVAIIKKPDQSIIQAKLASLFIYNPHRRAEAWRYLTYMLVHVHTSHLLVNLLVQITLGILLEMVHHWWRVALVYLAGVLAGSLGTSVSDPATFLAGASGGVYALMTAHLATLILNWSEMRFAWVQLMIFLFLTVFDVGPAVYYRYFSEPDNQVGYVAHLAGAVAGLLVGINVLRNLEVHLWEKRLRWVSSFVFIALLLSAITWNAAFPSYFPKQHI